MRLSALTKPSGSGSHLEKLAEARFAVAQLDSSRWREMATAARSVAGRIWSRSCSPGPDGSAGYSAKVPSTDPSRLRIGDDQQALSPALAASAVYNAHSGSLAMSSTTTSLPRHAAVPQEPTPSPMAIPSTARVLTSGRLGAAP